MPAQIFATTQAQYVDALTIALSQQISEIDFLVSSPNFALAQVAKLSKSGSPQWDTNELAIEPGSGSYKNIYGLRFRSFDPANPTVVKAIAYFADDPTPQGFVPSSAVFGTNGQVVAGGNVITGRVSSAGVLQAGTGFTPSRTGTGAYTVVYSTAFAGIPIVLANALDGGTMYSVYCTTNTSTGFTLQIFRLSGGVATATDTDWWFTAQAVV